MGWETVLGAVAGPLIGGLFADDTSGAIEQSGAGTAAASKYATDQQYKMFQEQQANANLKYNQTRGDLSSLFGGSGTNMFGANYGPNSDLMQQILARSKGTASTYNELGNQQLRLFNSFNPYTMAQDIYGKLTALGQPQRQQEQANLESRLLNQGILSGTPGQMQLTAQNEAFGQQDLARQIQAIMQAQAQQQQYFQNALGATGMGTALDTAGQNLLNASTVPALQAAGITAGVPINSGQPIPTGALGVQGVQAQGAANVEAANIRDSFWGNLINNQGVQSGISSLFSNLGNGNLGLSGGVPINTNPGLSGSEGLFSLINGYGGGV